LRLKEHCLFPGSNYRYLAQFLCQTQTSQPLTDESYIFVASYDLNIEGDERFRTYSAGGHGLEEFASHSDPLTRSGGHLLFMRGFPSPQWLCLIGWRYRIDPEYFRRHLNFCETNDHFELPSNLSSARNIIKIPIHTIGKRNSIKSSTVDFNQRRLNMRASVSSHLHKLRQHGQLGDSIIRKAMVFDDQYSTIEQTISVCVEKKAANWMC
jgi:hypothetical protein